MNTIKQFKLFIMSCFIILSSQSSFGQDPETFFLNGKQNYEKKNYTEAIAYFNKAIMVSHKKGESYYYKGKSYYALKEYRTARYNYHLAIKALKGTPLLAEAYFGKALSMIMLNEYQSSIGNFDKAIELNPKERKYYIFQAFVYRSLDYKEKACLTWQKAKKLAPSNRTGTENMLENYCNKQ